MISSRLLLTYLQLGWCLRGGDLRSSIGSQNQPTPLLDDLVDGSTRADTRNSGLCCFLFSIWNSQLQKKKLESFCLEGSYLPLLFRGLLDIFLSSAILTLLLTVLHLIRGDLLCLALLIIDLLPLLFFFLQEAVCSHFLVQFLSLLDICTLDILVYY